MLYKLLPIREQLDTVRQGLGNVSRSKHGIHLCHGSFASRSHITLPPEDTSIAGDEMILRAVKLIVQPVRQMPTSPLGVVAAPPRSRSISVHLFQVPTDVARVVELLIVESLLLEVNVHGRKFGMKIRVIDLCHPGSAAVVVQAAVAALVAQCHDFVTAMTPSLVEQQNAPIPFGSTKLSPRFQPKPQILQDMFSAVGALLRPGEGELHAWIGVKTTTFPVGLALEENLQGHVREGPCHHGVRRNRSHQTHALASGGVILL